MSYINKIPYGDNLMEISYSGLKSWYETSVNLPGPKGFFERAGKAIVIIPAHLLIATAQSALMLIYDLMLSLLFAAAALCSGFRKKEFNIQLLGHLGSLGNIPEKALKNLAAAICPPAFYKSNNICEAQFQANYENIWAQELQGKVWDANQLGIFAPKFEDHKTIDLAMDFARGYTQCNLTTQRESKIIPSIGRLANTRANNLPVEISRSYPLLTSNLSKDLRTKDEKYLSQLPFGSSLMSATYSIFKGWHEKSAEKMSLKGVFEQFAKTLVLIPAHLLVGTVQAAAMLVYDLALAIIFSLAAILTGFKYYGINRQALGHLGSLSEVLGQGIKNLMTALLSPALMYKSNNYRDLQYRYQFGKVWAREAPQRTWELYHYEGTLSKNLYSKVVENLQESPIFERIVFARLGAALIIAQSLSGVKEALPRAVFNAIAERLKINKTMSLEQQVKAMAKKLEVALPPSLSEADMTDFSSKILSALSTKAPDIALILAGGILTQEKLKAAVLTNPALFFPCVLTWLVPHTRKQLPAWAPGQDYKSEHNLSVIRSVLDALFFSPEPGRRWAIDSEEDLRYHMENIVKTILERLPGRADLFFEALEKARKAHGIITASKINFSMNELKERVAAMEKPLNSFYDILKVKDKL